MTMRYARSLAVAMASALLAAGSQAKAQLAPTPPMNGTAGQLGLANAMYGNAPLNPYLNPYLMGMSPGSPDYLTYAYLANQRNGGIGSGVISGVRPAPGAPAGSAPAGQAGADRNAGPSTASRNAPYTSRPPVEQNRVTFPMDRASIPGANSGGYFQRGPTTSAQGAGRYYSRMNPARNNGR
jgi:hypothetical protein